MTSQPPPLIETSDPAELLGLGAGASLRDVKRAYAQLIKVYRPEQTPAEFQRINAAFEQLRGQLTAEQGPLPGRESREQERETTHENAPETAAAAPAPSPVAALMDAFSARLRALASVEELAGIWDGGLQQDLDLVEVMFELSPPAVLDYMAEAGQFAWPRLAERHYPLRGAVWTLHAQNALARGRCDELLEEARTDSFREAAEEDEELRSALWLPLTVAAWDRAPSALEHFDWALQPGALSDGAKAFLQASQLQDSLKRLESWRGLPPGFAALIRLGRVSPRLRHELLLSLEPSRHSHSEIWWKLCEKLSNEEKLLGFYLLETLAMLHLTYEARVRDLSAEEQGHLEQAVSDGLVPPTSLLYSCLIKGLMLGLLGAAVLVGVLVYRGYQALFQAGTGRALLPPFEALLVLLLPLLAAAIASSIMQDNRACFVLRRDLARSGLGYQQLVDWLDSQDKRKPAGIKGNASLKLFLTLNLAVQRSLWAEQRTKARA